MTRREEFQIYCEKTFFKIVGKNQARDGRAIEAALKIYDEFVEPLIERIAKLEMERENHAAYKNS